MYKSKITLTLNFVQPIQNSCKKEKITWKNKKKPTCLDTVYTQ